MSNVTLEQACTIVDTALAEGKSRNFAPLTVVVLDSGGYPVVLKRADESALLRHQIAYAKAWGTLGMGFGGRNLQARAKNNPAFFSSLSDMCGGNIVPNPGGVLIKDSDGKIVGAVGISGDTGENDEICAVAGIDAAGLIADTGAS